jgi:N-acetylmuramoyl-L-alanine amidase
MKYGGIFMVKLMLDAGHGMHTLGKGVPSMHEFEFNNPVARYVAEGLANYQNVQTFFAHDLSGERDIPLEERTDHANQLHVDAYFSFHANAGTRSASGTETFVYPNCPAKTRALGLAMHNTLVNTIGLKNRGLKTADFHVLRETDMSAVLFEHAFMTNAGDLALLKSDAFRRKCADSHIRAIAQVYGLLKKVVVIPKVIPAPVSGHVHRVLVNGVQVGSFGDVDNLVNVVKDQINNNVKQIEIVLV